MSGPPIDAGTYTATGTYQAVTGSAPIIIQKANATIAIASAEFTYNGQQQGTTGEVYGVGGVDLGRATITYSGGNPPLDVGGYTVTGNFAGNNDYAASTDTGWITIDPVQATVTVAPLTITYDGNAHGTSAEAYGIIPYGGTNPVDLGPASSILYGGGAAAPTAPGSYPVTASYSGGNSDYSSATGLGVLSIIQALPTINIAAAGGTYSGSAFQAAVTIKGVNNTAAASLEGVTPTVTYFDAMGNSLGTTAPSAIGNYSVVATFAGSTDYVAASTFATFTISQAVPTLTVNSANAYVINGVTNGALEGTAPTLTYYNADGSNPNTTPPTGTGAYIAVATFPGTADYTSAISLPYYFSYGATGSPPTVVVSINGANNGSVAYTSSSVVATASVNGQPTLDGVPPLISYRAANGNLLTVRCWPLGYTV